MDEAKTASNYGATFRRLRMTFGVKQKELAAAGVSIQTVSRFEHNDTGLEIRHADTLLGFLPATLYEYVQSNIWLPLDGFDGFLNYLGVLMVQPNAESLLQNAALNARITYARCGEDKYLFRAVMFASAQNDELQRHKERTAVMRQLLAVRQWTNYEFVLFRRALRGTLQLDDARQLWSRLLGVGNKRTRLNQRRQLLQVDALLTVLSRSIAGQDFRLARRALVTLQELDDIGGDTTHLLRMRGLEALLELRDPHGNVAAGEQLLRELIDAAAFLGDKGMVTQLSAELGAAVHDQQLNDQ
jgi:transcriptional regulator with XRE-family HTH domain